MNKSYGLLNKLGACFFRWKKLKFVKIISFFLLYGLFLVLLSYNLFGSSLDIKNVIEDYRVPWNSNVLWDPLPKQKKSYFRNVKVFVIEEHHEALSIWFEAYLNKSISPAVSIVHIDAHSDFALPFYEKDVDRPIFELPKNRQEIRPLIKRNDVFIMTAVNTGFVRDFVWIYPDWCNETDKNYEVVHVGYTKKKGKFFICLCYGNIIKDKVYCLIPPGNGEKKVTWLRNKNCIIKTKVSSLSISDANFLNFSLISRNWADTLNDIVLDIDLDFFGVYLIGHRLVEVGLLEKHLIKLNEMLSQFCITSGSHEIILNNAWSDIITLLLTDGLAFSKSILNTSGKYKKLLRNLLDSLPFCDIPLPKFLEKKYATFLFKQHGMVILNHLLQTLKRFNGDQLSVLRQIGICQHTTLMERKIVYPVICVGKNFPDNSSDNSADTFILPEHLPSTSELNNRFNRLEAVLRKLEDRPVLITLCRSGRDGYTPRHLLAQLEKGVIDVLTRVYNLNSSDVHHHPLLWRVPTLVD